MHPTITLDSDDFLTWREYFDCHIGGRPWTFQMLLDKEILEMCVPEQLPQWFDPSFAPNPRWRPAA